MKDYFNQIVNELFKNIKSNELLIINFDAEVSSFVRFNKAKIRQAGNVNQISMTLSLSNNENKNLKSVIRLSGDYKRDLSILIKSINYLRRELPELPKDPYMLFSKSNNSTEISSEERGVEDEQVIDYILSKSNNYDMVGIYSSGYIYTALATSVGQTNWHSNYSFSFDFSLYNENNSAIKLNYSSKKWSQNEFDRIFDDGLIKLNILSKPSENISTGNYSVYLEPSALNELVDMMAWGGFSYKANKIGTSPLHLLYKKEKVLNKSIFIDENIKDGIAANFNSEGFIKPKEINMICGGEYSTPLTSPRSSLEYSVKHNASDTHEYPTSIDMRAGSINSDDVLSTINNGIYISNLWYLNFSDRNNGRITGLTRFGCFKIQNGELVAPINTMRFDDSIYSMLGENLIGLTRNRELLIDSGTYEERSTSSTRLPGALINNFKMTL